MENPITRTATALFESSEKGAMLLPVFQRAFVWDREAQRSLAASLMLEIPCGSLLMLNGEVGEFSVRRIGRREVETELTEGAPCDLLLDGQQRVTSIYGMFADPVGDKFPKSWDWIQAPLRYRWSLAVSNQVNVKSGTILREDIFGFEDLVLTSLRVEPETIAERFEFHRVLKGDAKGARSPWFHPSRTNPKKGVAEARTKLIQACIKENRVPLWSVYSDQLAAQTDPLAKPIHFSVLKGIAAAQSERLHARIMDGNASPTLRRALGEESEELAELSAEELSEVPPDLVRQAVTGLAAAWVQRMSDLISNVTRFRFPIIEVPHAQLDRAIVIFESINRGGTQLSPFDLVSARHARIAPPKDLASLVSGAVDDTVITINQDLLGKLGDGAGEWRPSVSGIAVSGDELTKQFKTRFLIMLNLLARVGGAGLEEIFTGEEGRLVVGDFKPKASLKLLASDIDAHWEAAVSALMRAWAFLQVRCGVRGESDLRNELLIIPLAVVLSRPGVMNDATMLDRLEYWYWCSVLSDAWTTRQNEQALEDTRSLVGWLLGEDAVENPFVQREKKVLSDPGYSDRPTLLREVADAAVTTDVGVYLLQYELSTRPLDLIDGSVRLQAWESEKLHDHHIVALGTAATMDKSAKKLRKQQDADPGRTLNSPLNRTFILDRSNLAIGSLAPSGYWARINDGGRTARFLPELPPCPTADDYVTLARDLMGKRFDVMKLKIAEELTGLKH